MGASKGRTLLLALLLAPLLARAAQAQLWRGPAAIEVRAEDKGKPAAGGEVRLEFLDMEPPAGPAPVKLDGRGRAVVSSLAEGRWRVEVSREGAMTYRAEVLVRRDGRPDVIEAVQHNVPGAVSMMEVKLARARGGAPPPSQAPEPTVIAPSAPSAPAETTEATEVEPLEPLRPVSEPERPRTPEPATPVAPAQPTPSAPPQQVPVSAAEPLRQAPSTTAPTAPVAPATPPVVPAPTPKPAPSRPAPAPSTPQPVPAPVPTPEPERPAPVRPVAPPDRSASPPPAQTPPVAAPPPAGPVLKRTFQDRTCVECRPGESSLSMEVLASPSAAGCGDGLRDNLTRLDVASMGEGCHLVRIDLPRNARFVGYRYEVQDGGGQGSDCLAGKDCPAGGRWPVDPVLRRDGAGTTTVATAFENRGDRERRAVLTVYFKEGGGADAPRPMMPTKAKKPPG